MEKKNLDDIATPSRASRVREKLVEGLLRLPGQGASGGGAEVAAGRWCRMISRQPPKIKSSFSGCLCVVILTKAISLQNLGLFDFFFWKSSEKSGREVSFRLHDKMSIPLKFSQNN